MGSWFGRPLPRPAEDLEDQGLGFDVETLLNRRAFLRGVGLGAVGLGLAACSSDSGGGEYVRLDGRGCRRDPGRDRGSLSG